MYKQIEQTSNQAKRKTESNEIARIETCFEIIQVKFHIFQFKKFLRFFQNTFSLGFRRDAGEAEELSAATNRLRSCLSAKSQSVTL